MIEQIIDVLYEKLKIDVPLSKMTKKDVIELLKKTLREVDSKRLQILLEGLKKAREIWIFDGFSIKGFEWFFSALQEEEDYPGIYEDGDIYVLNDHMAHLDESKLVKTLMHEIGHSYFSALVSHLDKDNPTLRKILDEFFAYFVADDKGFQKNTDLEHHVGSAISCMLLVKEIDIDDIVEIFLNGQTISQVFYSLINNFFSETEKYILVCYLKSKGVLKNNKCSSESLGSIDSLCRDIDEDDATLVKGDAAIQKLKEFKKLDLDMEVYDGAERNHYDELIQLIKISKNKEAVIENLKAFIKETVRLAREGISSKQFIEKLFDLLSDLVEKFSEKDREDIANKTAEYIAEILYKNKDPAIMDEIEINLRIPLELDTS